MECWINEIVYEQVNDSSRVTTAVSVQMDRLLNGMECLFSIKCLVDCINVNIGTLNGMLDMRNCLQASQR